MSEAAEAVMVLWPGALLILLSVPMIQGKVARSRSFGFRIAATLSDDRVWYPINRSAGWHMVCAGVIPIAVVLAWAMGLYRGSPIVALPVMLIVVTITTLVDVRKARRLKAALDGQAEAARAADRTD